MRNVTVGIQKEEIKAPIRVLLSLSIVWMSMVSLAPMVRGSNLSADLLLWGEKMKHSLREYEAQACGLYEAATSLPWSEARLASSCAEGTLHSNLVATSFFMRVSALRWKKPFAKANGFFLWLVSDLDAKPCVADLDARRFCRGYTNPLAMMGVKSIRDLPGF